MDQPFVSEHQWDYFIYSLRPTLGLHKICDFFVKIAETAAIFGEHKLNDRYN